MRGWVQDLPLGQSDDRVVRPAGQRGVLRDGVQEALQLTRCRVHPTPPASRRARQAALLMAPDRVAPRSPTFAGFQLHGMILGSSRRGVVARTYSITEAARLMG